MTQFFDPALVLTQIPQLLLYLPVTLELTLLALIIGWVLGLILAMVQIKKIPVLRQLASFFISIIRGTPLIVQLYVSLFGIPTLLRYINYLQGTNFNVNSIPPFIFAVVALGLNQAAFDSQTIRASLLSVDQGQIEAARSLGMTEMQILRRVMIPQAIRVAIPSLGNSLIGLIKGTSLAFVASVVEITAQGRIMGGQNYRYFEVYLSLAIIYWAITLIIERIFRWIEKKSSIPEEAPELSIS